ncbi:hypothetical protein PAAG_01220 [Paracoccidioides lutzii Pb01]|uniref:Uncharacterized protein n=1 Tax=Paracoccidioides lutzii (strain ATCC MYA-826 / Pb01) TaxID=502779 RepID=C1GRS5_PARBA|nr:hypothetical protein PAAG_01220 [Paracoccidioides lutzii Pb01]EEH38299.2 hypothetical protein PAAG_01220 [Paracoccidioides lutzii Pb01]
MYYRRSTGQQHLFTEEQLANDIFIRKQFTKLRIALIRNNAGLLQYQTLYVEGQQLAPLAFSSQGQNVLALPGRDVLIHPHPISRNGGEASGLMVPAPFLNAFGYPGTSGEHVRIASGAITELDAPYKMTHVVAPIFLPSSLPQAPPATTQPGAGPSPGHPTPRRLMVTRTGTGDNPIALV